MRSSALVVQTTIQPATRRVGASKVSQVSFGVIPAGEEPHHPRTTFAGEAETGRVSCATSFRDRQTTLSADSRMAEPAGSPAVAVRLFLSGSIVGRRRRDPASYAALKQIGLMDVDGARK